MLCGRCSDTRSGGQRPPSYRRSFLWRGPELGCVCRAVGRDGAARRSAASRGVLACTADCWVPLLQTPMKKTNALIAQMGVTFSNAVSACLNALRL